MASRFVRRISSFRFLPVTARPTCLSHANIPRQSHIAPLNRRWASTAKESADNKSNASAGMYAAALFISMLGLSYAAVPLYRLFCASTGYSGTPVTDKSRFGPERLVPKDEKKRIRITFESNTSDALPWSFKPELREVWVVPGETALTFYQAKSKAKEDIVGIATYNVAPHRAGSYFNKIQCFCFEEQKLSPGEDVDMPVFFFIDPDFLEDPYMKDVNTITLSYTFFNAKYAKHLSPGQPQS
ncbi:cytochrome c oxidase assembly protein CtaG/Cox11-domain-containing protein [Radiomyces spectabilis]|uniref:cytochrome c oxidase assembly protein CtaG/Cox11-domain-containing protein n=1 Tax=Radiomyces spectabilis TaxID=64574 RepID=UPI00221F8585|nr:cytochrome c oxidase assembly protein CtaG/Cox11-domain-containing protein [Radiomyces spectabilis]KAI8391111.1 cytochrome c oxidase assembly protein CtaG/Cox11-domain-containing protein [Radiomyces spectabilis]